MTIFLVFFFAFQCTALALAAAVAVAVAVYSLQCTVYSLQFTVYSLQCTLYSVQFTVYSVQCTVYSLQCTVYSVHFTVYSLQFTVYSLQFTVYSLQFTVYSLQFTVYSLHLHAAYRSAAQFRAFSYTNVCCAAVTERTSCRSVGAQTDCCLHADWRSKIGSTLSPRFSVTHEWLVLVPDDGLSHVQATLPQVSMLVTWSTEVPRQQRQYYTRVADSSRSQSSCSRLSRDGFWFVLSQIQRQWRNTRRSLPQPRSLLTFSFLNLRWLWQGAPYAKLTGLWWLLLVFLPTASMENGSLRRCSIQSQALVIISPYRQEEGWALCSCKLVSESEQQFLGGHTPQNPRQCETNQFFLHGQFI